MPETLSYQITLNCPIGADVRHESDAGDGWTDTINIIGMEFVRVSMKEEEDDDTLVTDFTILSCDPLEVGK